VTFVLPGRSVAQPLDLPLETRTARRPPLGTAVNDGPPNRMLYVRLCRMTDMAAALLSLIAASLVTSLGRMPGGLGTYLAVRISLEKLLVALVFLLAWRGVLTLSGLYDWRRIGTRSRELARAAIAGTLGSGFTLIIALDSASGAFSAGAMLDYWLIATALVLLLRGVLRTLVFDAPSSAPRDVLIVGSGPRAVDAYRRLSADRRVGYNVLGFVDSNDAPASEEIGRRLLGGLDQLEAIVMRRPLDEVLIALPMRSRYNAIHDAIRICERAGVRAKYLADMFPDSRAWPRFEESGQVAAVAMPIAPEDGRLVVKRLVDIAGSIIGLFVLSPLLIAIALAIRLTSPGMAIFVQERVGFNKRRFRMYKFRTMTADAEERQESVEHLNEACGPIFKIRDDPRLTPLGGFLRKSSLDELPQLANVLRGEMSLVGPRPMSLRDVSRFTDPGAMRRFSMRPGLTCLWQIQGRSDLGFADWLRLDLEYIDRWSLLLDFRILLQTLPAVLQGVGAE
jgi:exopolysaccharide biosynthesis polyprenyl glycosylphosphotransferase